MPETIHDPGSLSFDTDILSRARSQNRWTSTFAGNDVKLGHTIWDRDTNRTRQLEDDTGKVPALQHLVYEV